VNVDGPTNDIVRRVVERFQGRALAAAAGDPAAEQARTTPVLQPGQAEGFDPVAGMLEARIGEAIARDYVHPARVELPAQGRAPFRVTDKNTGMWIEVTPMGMADAEAQVADGYVIYREGMAGALGLAGSGHVIHRVHVGGTEDFIELDRAPATAQVRYRVRLSDAVAGLRVVDNNVEFVDQGNGPRLRMAAPYLFDVRARRHNARVTVPDCKFDSNPAAPWGRHHTPPGARLCTIEVSWKDANVAYPALLDPAWTTVASMSVVRANHTLTRISAAKVELALAAGGENSGGLLSSAALYNPSSKTWAATGAMPSDRTLHTATLLTDGDNGKVLVAGGAYNDSNASTGARTYDPATGAWTNVASMKKARVYHSAIRLGDGRVLVAGGCSTYPSFTLNTNAEIYDPPNNTWNYTGNLITARAAGTLLLREVSGSTTKVLYAGGTPGGLTKFTDVEQLTVTAPNYGTWNAGGISQLPSGMTWALGFGSGAEAKIVGSGTLAYKFNDNAWSAIGPTTNTYLVPTGAPLNATGTEFLVLSTGGAEVYRSGFLVVPSTPVSHERGASARMSDGSVVATGGYNSTAGTWTATTHVFRPLAQGAACTNNGECASKFCVDGYCCNTACTELCKACSAAKKEQGSNGVCGFVAAGKLGDSECPNDGAGTCDHNGRCDGAGACQLYVAGTTCATSNCSSGTLTLHQCNGSGTCVDSTQGCDPYVCQSSSACYSTCSSDTACATGHYCSSGTCVDKKAQGASCTGNNQCLTNFCADGVCCNSACTGLCKGCTAAIKGPGGGADGECGFVVTGVDNQGECAQDLASTCQKDGTCNGAGACKLWYNVSCGSTWCDANTLKGQMCDGLGNCVNDPTGGQACSPYLCQGSSCTSPCVADSSCITNYWCGSGVCQAKLANGQPCTAGSQCVNGNCIDGYCCNTACSGLCYACSAAKKHQGINGECGPVLSGQDDDNDCAVGAECKEDGTCNGSGACRMVVSGAPCGSTVCLANAVAGQHCNGLGSCVNNSSGTDCAPYLCSSGACTTPCALDAHCLTGHFCDNGSCTAKVANGTPCTSGSQCSTGNCVDGFCCDAACSSTCQACSAEKKGTGANGVCGWIVKGADPDEECAEGDQCGNTGSCDGAGACDLRDAGTICGATQCVLNKVTGQVCNGTGLCINDAVGTECSPYLCSGGACTNPCLSDSHCISGYSCINNQCIQKKANGATCTLDNECALGNCVDNVCCATACSGLCSACSAAMKGGGIDGECGGIAAGTDPQNECEVEAMCGKDGTCNGSGACRLKVSGTSCGSSQCLLNKVTGQVCNGDGLCVNDSVGVECGSYLCISGACASPCASDSHCVLGYFCASGTCTAKKPAGGACSLPNECSTNNCVDGVCCNSVCSGLCQACSASKKGAGASGECGPIVSGSDPDLECDVEASCGKDGTCNGSGACRLKQAGVSCGTSQCVLNKVTGQVCDGAGLCINDAVGTECGAYLCSGGACSNPCVADANCTAGNFCINGTCSAKKALGQSCSLANECVSNQCVDGYCCNSACSGLCNACSTAKKGSGANGDCGPINAGIDPDEECQLEAGCGQDGTCNGASACRLKLAGVSCGSSQCVGNTVKGQVCDGDGLCINDAVGTDCSPHLCSGGACINPCIADANCQDGYFCDGGTCAVKLATGQACSGEKQCTTGFCVDGYCCDTACSGLCAACSATKKAGGADGECGMIQAGGDPDDECAIESGCGADGTCDGSGTCRLKVAGTSCGASQCLLNKVTGQVCDGKGLCVNDAVGTECSPHLCSGGACKNPCVADSDCIKDYFCSAGACVVKKDYGEACTQDLECGSGFCVDSVCCSSACSGLCSACSFAKKGVGMDGECGPVETGADPDGECDEEAGCGRDGTCNGGGSCRLKQPGVSCGTSQCTNNKVTGQVCNGSGACVNEASGIDCGLFLCTSGSCNTPCLTDAHCVQGSFCLDGSCVKLLSNGSPCVAGNACASSYCADGVCCDKACTSPCSACTAVLKESGIDGECGPVLQGTDPHNDCTKDLPSSCQRDGECDGTGTCRLYQEGVTCNPSSCSGNLLVAQVCNGIGNCLPSAVTTPCSPYMCSSALGACAMGCQTDAECFPQKDYWCFEGKCEPKGAVGDQCTDAAGCASGFCVDKVCCDTECVGQCQACDITGSEGTCSLVTGAPHGTRPKCKGEGTACEGTCNGALDNECEYKTGAVCGSTCKDGSETPKLCDGKGGCAESTSKQCSPYLCDKAGASCMTTCKADTDCTTGFTCEVVSGKCVEKGSTCKNDFTAVAPNGTETDCKPYKCSAGACRDACSVSGDCSAGYACSGSKCVLEQGDGGSLEAGAPAVSIEQDKGCGCSTPGQSTGRSRGVFALLLMLAASALRLRRAA